MLFPSGIRPIGDQKVETTRVSDGLYVGTNAYDGVYEYFEGRPVDEVSAEASDPTPIAELKAESAAR